MQSSQQRDDTSRTTLARALELHGGEREKSVGCLTVADESCEDSGAML